MRIILFILFITYCYNLQGQQTLELNLEEIVALAQDQPSDELKARIILSVQAPDSKIANTRLSNNFWQYQAFQADFKPQIALNSSLPRLNRDITLVTQPDGSPSYERTFQIANSLNVALTQPIVRTGGRISLSTGLNRLDVFQPTPFRLYFSNPINIGFDQPLFAFNQLKWDKIIEPMRYNEAKRAFNEDMEAIASEAVQLFFDVFIAQLSLEAAQGDKNNADTLYRISQGRFSVGRIAETELLQIELSKMNADADLARATLDLQTSTENLRNFLGIKEFVKFRLSPPDEIPEFVIDPQRALSRAKASRSQVLAFDRRLKEAERDLERAEKNNGFSLSVNGGIGVSQAGDSLIEVYTNVGNQQYLTVQLNVPIMDWGRAEARRQIAISNQELVQMNVEQDRINFERDILLKVQQFDLVRNQTKLAQRNFEVTQKTYDLTRKRYLIGKIGVTDLNIALSNLVRSRTSYMNALRSFWVAYYEIRRLTLYDFMNDKSLSKSVD